MNTAPVIAGTYRFFEEFMETVPEWDLDFTQLGPSASQYRLTYQPGNHFIFARSFFGNAFHQRGMSPSGYRTFSLLASGSTPLRWHGEVLRERGLILMPRGGEFESRSDPGFDFISLSISEVLLNDIARSDYGLPLDELLSEDRLFCADAGDSLLRLRRVLEAYDAALTQRTVSGAPPFSRHVASELLRIAVTDQCHPPAGAARSRQQLVRRALEMVEASPHGLSVPMLTQELKVARRTLEYAFNEILGVSPAIYIKRYRLQKLRDELVERRKREPIANLAKGFGFTHGGQLACDYRALFGESPSSTQQRILRKADKPRAIYPLL